MHDETKRVLGRVLAVAEMKAVAGGTDPHGDVSFPGGDTDHTADSVPSTDTIGGPGEITSPTTGS